MKIRLVLLNTLSTVMFVCLTIPTFAVAVSGVMDSVVMQSNDSLELAKESQHFNFYSTPPDIRVLDSLATTLENNYSRIMNILGARTVKRIDVKVYPDIKSFHVASKYPDAPDWLVGTCYGEELLMVSPLNPGSVHTYQSLMQVIVHEFVHLAVFYARGDKGMIRIPTWLNEGFAQYEAGQINDRIRKSVESSLAGQAVPTWTQLEKSSAMEFGNMNGYGLSVTIVEFLVVKYGMDKLVLLIKEPENLESIYGLSKDSLEKRWIQYVKHETIE